MRDVISGVLGSRFVDAASAEAKPKPKKRRASPLSIRLSEDERSQLQALAGRTPLGTYVKACLFDGKTPRKAPKGNSARDYELLARLLAGLGQTDAFRNLDQLVRMAEDGSLDLSDETVQTILAACVCLSAMRGDLVKALGLRGG
ncbi:MAG: hypothetical protein QNJ13_13325 [Paracoccaceae bacterium]|nr:hypothetical protein [Paracoccaceae bacterium]